MKKRSLMLMTVCLLAIGSACLAQEKQPAIPGTFTKEQLKANWEKFNKDDGFATLVKDVKGKGFAMLEGSAWGFEGSLPDASGKEQPILFCAYDFYNPKAAKGQGCSMIWKSVAGKVYKAYLVFPEGEKNVQAALKGGMEWYADDNAKIQRAHSWGSCFLKCVQTNGSAPGIDVDIKSGRVKVGGKSYTINCTTGCYTGAIVCSGIAAGVAVGGVSVPFAIAILAVCTSGTCLPCMALCSLGCM
jgi:hypothetical protein